MSNSDNSTKDLILLRGLPGSGKTTLAGILSDKLHPVFSIDQYFMKEDGTYEFRFNENHLAYKACEENTRRAMQSGTPKIFVENTFTIDWEIEPYFKLAAEYNYRLHIVTVENYHGGKNSHEVTDEQLQKMAAKYSVRLI